MKIAPRMFPGLLLMLLFSAATSIAAQEVQNVERPGVSDMLADVTPAVVNIAVTGSRAIPQNPLLNDPFFRRFFDIPEQQQPQRQPTQSVGSGVIIDAENGYILTNHHVVSNAEEMEIILQDRRRIEATLIGSDAGTDIALLQVEAENLHELMPSNSDTLRVGDFVVAIGNPFGIGQTVTTGIVSALGRGGISQEGYEDFIQTDASINPGNSGGALVDYNGRLVGINTAIIAPAGGNVGIGFSVPINMAMSIVNQLLEFGEISRGMLGVEIQDLTPDVVAALDLDITEGAIVSRVVPDSPAAEAGIEAGDIITGVDGETMTSGSHLRNTIGLIRAGTPVEIELLRGNDRMTIMATLSGSSEPVAATQPTESDGVLDGAQLSGIPSNHPAYGDVMGVLVTNVVQGSRAFSNGLRPNDIITAANQQPVNTPDALEEILAASTSSAVALNVVREGQNLFLIVR